MSRKLFSLLFLITAQMFLWIGSSDSQEIFPSQKELSVIFRVNVERNTGKLDYLYTLSSSPQSKQIVYLIAIENRGDIGTVKTPRLWREGGYIKGSRANKVVSWFPGQDRRVDVLEAPINSIEPGQTSEVFGVLGVNGPPTIVSWRVEGWTPVPILDEDRGVIISGGKEYNAKEWADTIMNHPNTMPNNPDENFVRGFTLGPSKPPTDPSILCDTFILDLISQVREAVSQGWIKHDLRKDDDNRGKGKGDEKGVKKGQDDDDRRDGDDHADDDVEMGEKDKGLPGVAKSIIKKLTKVRRECTRGKLGTAREKLRALIKQVNAQRGKHLTEEAYALIKFNAEFLLEKL